ncbi:MAG TPA: hypothetical protein VJQ83_02050 [Tepidiformaceae bacterium]|nr:hypothetical protein [Tepidiformaceae bacterium]
MLTDADPELARRLGRFIMAGAVIAAALYAIGVARRSYLAVALPVSILMGVAVSAAIFLGRLLVTTPDEPPDPS